MNLREEISRKMTKGGDDQKKGVAEKIACVEDGDEDEMIKIEMNGRNKDDRTRVKGEMNF